MHQGCFEDGNEGDSVYLAPEVLDGGHHVSAAADIFSLGLMLFELGAQKTLPPNGSLWHTLRSEAPSRLTCAPLAPQRPPECGAAPPCALRARARRTCKQARTSQHGGQACCA